MKSFDHVCSLGTLCHAAAILKRNKVKMASYPFDWIFSDCDIVNHCIKDNFKTFLDKNNYTTISHSSCGNTVYNIYMFNHHNPLINEEHYNYFTRCVNRFNDLIKHPGPKLFVMMFINMSCGGGLGVR